MTFKTITLMMLVCAAACGEDEVKPEHESTSSSALSLAGSKFEIDSDANLVVDTAGDLDWINVNDVKQPDLATGQADDSYGGGAKEDDACPPVGFGSIPNNKSDLKMFSIYVEPGSTPGDPGYLHLAWSRVQDPTGTTLMDFEFNQSKGDCGNGVNPVRTPGDFLLEYRLAQGGATATLKLRRWTGSAWGAATDLTTQAIGDINDSAILAADSDGFGAMSPRTFGEASVDLSAIFDATKCESFGKAFVKSRAADSFSSQLKDFIKPAEIDLTNCGSVIIRKKTVPTGLTDSFTYTDNLKTDPTNTTTTFNLTDGGSQTFSNVLLGTGYTVAESAATGFNLTSIDCSASSGVTTTTSLATGTVSFDIDSSSDKVDCTYTNTHPTGAILITKTRKHAADGSGDHPQSGVTFSVSGGNLATAQTAQTNAFGVACIDGLDLSGAVGDYTVTETVPTGYSADGGSTQSVTVSNASSCGDGNETGVSFHNTPLTTIKVSVDSIVSGGTSSTILCTGMGSAASTDSTGDGEVTRANLVPGTYTCTIDIDP